MSRVLQHSCEKKFLNNSRKNARDFFINFPSQIISGWHFILVETEAALRNTDESTSTEDASQNEDNTDDARNSRKNAIAFL